MQTYNIYDENGDFVELLEAETDAEISEYFNSIGKEGWTFEVSD